MKEEEEERAMEWWKEDDEYTQIAAVAEVLGANEWAQVKGCWKIDAKKHDDGELSHVSSSISLI